MVNLHRLVTGDETKFIVAKSLGKIISQLIIEVKKVHTTYLRDNLTKLRKL